MRRNPDFGGFLSETFALFGDAIRYCLAYIAFVGGLGALGILMGWAEATSNIFSIGASVELDQSTELKGFAFQFLILIVSIVASYFLVTKLLEMRNRLGSGGTRIWAYIGLGILFVLGFSIGLILLVIPGLILLTRWSASTGYLLGAREGVVDSLSSSWEATSGFGFPIFFAGVVMVLTAGFVGAIFGGIVGASGNAIAIGVINPLAEAFGNALSYCFAIAVYHLVSDDTSATTEIFE